MKKIKNILVLDTETTGDFSQPMIYDFGYKIVTPTGEVLCTRNAIVKEIFENKFVIQKAYYASKMTEYRKMIEQGQIEYKSFKSIIKQFIDDARKHKVEIISAYNLAFDMKAINATMRLCYSQGDDEKIIEKLINQKNKKLLCIWNLACETILDTDEYREFATSKGWISEAGNYKTNAEVTYTYISGLEEFTEKHMALDDVNIEIDILLHILKNYDGNLTYGLHYGSWKKVQK